MHALRFGVFSLHFIMASSRISNPELLFLLLVNKKCPQIVISWFILKCYEGERMKATYRVYRFDIKMTTDQSKLEQFLNSLEGEVVAIIPNVSSKPLGYSIVDFLWIVEKVI